MKTPVSRDICKRVVLFGVACILSLSSQYAVLAQAEKSTEIKPSAAKPSAAKPSAAKLSDEKKSSEAVKPSEAAYKEVEAEFIKCAEEARDSHLDSAEAHGENALKLLGTYEDRFKIGLLLLMANVELCKKNQKYCAELAEKAMLLSERLEGKQSSNYASAITMRGNSYSMVHQWIKAEPLFLSAVDKFDSIFAAERARGKSTNFEQFKQDYMAALNGAIWCTVATNKDNIALKIAEKILKLGNKELTTYDLNLTLASASAQAGMSCYKDGAVATAKPLLEKSIRIYNQWKARNPTVPAGSKQLTLPFPSIIEAMRSLSVIYVKAGKSVEGKKLQQEAARYQEMRASMRH